MSTNPTPTTINDGLSGDALKQFQLTTEGIKDKSSDAFGTEVSKKIWGTVNAGAGSYYFARNARFTKNRAFANGIMDVEAMYKDRFHFDGKPNYIALNWRTLQIVNRIISGLVGRWMQRGEKIQVEATDPLSVKDKQRQYEEIEFIVSNRRKIEELQQQSGMPLIPEGNVPLDKDELNLWKQELQRTPEEILFETGTNDVLSSNGCYDVLKEKWLHDSAEVLFVGTYTWMDSDGVIHVEWVKPENAIYSASDFPDFRDTSWRGQVPSRKISEIRKMYGKEFGGKLTEAQLWQIAQSCKEYQNSTNIIWQDTWFTAFLRPYDEWNIRVMEFELKTVDSEPYTVTKSKLSNSTYTQRGYPTTASGKRKEKPSDNQQVIEDKNWNIYRGVYLPDCDMLLEWGLKKNMIRPQDPKEIGNAEFSYSFYMPQNYLMRNLAVPEKIEAAVDGMILALLKMQQVVARMRPTGAAINESALQNIDYGLGEAGNKDIDYKKLYDQTGDIYYRGEGEDGRPIPIPIQELANSGFLGQMDGLIKNYAFNYQALKDELGEDPNLISQAVQPRVAAGNVEASQLQSEYATDYMYRAYAELMKITARKVSCLLKDSVKYGAKVYREIQGIEETSTRQFNTDIKFLPTQNDVMRFEAMMNQAIVAKPELIQFLDPFNLLRVAREDAKLAELMFRNAQKKMVQHEQQIMQQNQQATIQGQIDSAVKAEEEKRKTIELEIEAEQRKSEITGQAQNRSALLNGALALLKSSGENKGGTIPPNIMPFVMSVLQNVGFNAMLDTAEQKQQLLSDMQAAAQMAQQPQATNQQPEMAA